MLSRALSGSEARRRRRGRARWSLSDLDRHRREREAQTEGRASVGWGLGPDTPSICFAEAARDGEPESDALAVVLSGKADEGLEHLFEVARVDGRSVVDDPDPDFIWFRGDRDDSLPPAP